MFDHLDEIADAYAYVTTPGRVKAPAHRAKLVANAKLARQKAGQRSHMGQRSKVSLAAVSCLASHEDRT
jgi:hypothetical protein